MAQRAFPLIAGVLVAGLVLAPLLAVSLRAGEIGFALTTADWAAIRFTLVQAVLSSALSVLLAVPVARALARRSFPGRNILVTMLGVPFLLPVIVAVLGLLAVFGRSGWVNDLLTLAGLPGLSIYGLSGVVMAHTFFNLPLAARLILQGWHDIPGEQHRLAANLGFAPMTYFRVIEWPMLQRVVPGAALVIFLVCLSSFAVALILGGGPRATTIELAIYQAFRFEFDLGRAAQLALVQLFIAAMAGVLAFRLTLPAAQARGFARPIMRWDSHTTLSRLIDTAALVLATLFLVLPLAAVVARGAPELGGLPASVWQAAFTSLSVAAASTLLCLALALPLAASRTGWVSLLGIAISPLVLGTGAFILIHPFANPGAWALTITAVVNALMALPFAVRAVSPGLDQLRADFDHLSQSLGLTGWQWWQRVGLPRLAQPIGFSAGLTAALSMGDLGVIALFGDPDRATLPLQMFRLMGAYRMDEAAGAAILLVGLTLAVFWILDNLGRRHA